MTQKRNIQRRTITTTTIAAYMKTDGIHMHVLIPRGQEESDRHEARSDFPDVCFLFPRVFIHANSITCSPAHVCVYVYVCTIMQIPRIKTDFLYSFSIYPNT